MKYSYDCYVRLAEVARMDDIVRNFNDEYLIDIWLTYGCPDESSLEDYMGFAEDPDEYNELVDLFNDLLKRENA